MTHKETVEAYIREQIPELMELSVGCWLNRKDKDGDYMVITDTGFGRRENAVWVASCVHGSMGIHWKDTEEVKKSVLEDTQGEHWGIIGHPIHLEHVLRVLDAKDEHLDVHFWGDGRIEVLAYNDENLVRIQVLLPLISPDTWPEETWEQLSDLLGLSK